MRIKIIDLLNKIANGEEVPKKIKYKGIIREYEDKDKDYISWETNADLYLFFDLFKSNSGNQFETTLNDEVEILDEEDEFEDIEEMNLDIDCTTEYNFGEVYDTINQLINNQKKIIERLKND